MSFLGKYVTKYLDTRIVFVLDLLLSVICSVITFLVMNLFASRNYSDWNFIACWVCGAIISTVAVMLIFRNYERIIRHMSMVDLEWHLFATAAKEVIFALILLVLLPSHKITRTFVLALSCDFLFTAFAIVGVRICMIVTYDYLRNKIEQANGRRRAFVYGTGPKSVGLITRLQTSRHFNVVGIIDDHDDEQKNISIANFNILRFNTKEELASLISKYQVGCIIFPTESSVRNETVISCCGEKGVATMVAPSIDEVVGGRLKNARIREVNIEDLLGRDEIKISMDEIKAQMKGKTVMITGAAGSIGSELCRQIAVMGVEQLILFDNSETPLHNLRLELEVRFPYLKFVPCIGSVKNLQRVDYAFRNWKPDIVFHAAAYKHVPLMEENPCEAVLTNVLGSKNIADKCIEYGVEKMVMISTDKAVNPTNIMGCSKRLAEIYVQSLGLAMAAGHVKGKTKFVTTRFGNVLGSNGSVIPHFQAQIAGGGPVTVTHPDITRFFMTIPEACRLVMEAATMDFENRIFVFDMGESVKIDTLARRMIELAGLKVGEDIEIVYSGLRPGEKLYEEVLANNENTDPTSHERIRIARVREYDYEEASKSIDELTNLATQVDIPAMVIKMKQIVPEFKSKNSKFEIYDK
ncbi:MAG: polysaccharide biosynthesis protein [Bacteroidales bacterium]|nr:polysaccharide biosynthesis protein [Bacteroidales bacterium]